MDRDDRDRGILTATDRDWLRKQTDGSTDSSSHQGDSQRRKAISNRVVNALEDFEILTEELPEMLLEDVVLELRRQQAYTTGLSSAIAFLYLLANEKTYLANALLMGDEGGAHRLRTFENTLNEGIATARRQTDWYTSPSEDPAVSPDGRLYELPPTELISAEEIFDQWKAYGQWRDPETGERLYESDKYMPSEAKQIALGNVIDAVETLQQREDNSRLSVPSNVRLESGDHQPDDDSE